MVTPLRILFCGTPQFAVPTLQHLLADPGFEIAAVITQPDRPRGRGQDVSFSPVKLAAIEAGVSVFQPDRIRAPESESFLRETRPKAIVIIAYGQIIPARLLTIPPLGWVNAHGSLLPKYRGAAPIQWAIANGELRTGVTTMKIDAGMDTGEMLLRAETEIGPAETTPQLAGRLARISAPLVAETLRGLRDGSLSATPQNHAEATLAPLLSKADGRIQWTLPAQQIYNRMRGFAPWPGAYTTFRGSACQLYGEPASNRNFDASLDEGSQNDVPGRISLDGTQVHVSCGEKTLLALTRVKVEGRNEVSAAEFVNGTHVRAGEHFV
jgi:methionyl-tRNA formyltransferase